MSSDEHKEQEEEEEPQPQPQQQQYPESRQADSWNKDVDETGRWGSRSRKELFVVAGLILVIVGATIAGVVLTSSSGESPTSGPVGVTKVDPATGKRVSAYQLPVPPTPTTVSDQQELDLLREQIAANAAMSKHLAFIPASVADLEGTSDNDSADPYARAASWLVTVDTTNAEEVAVTRFALAAIYYVNAGANWTNATNWLSTTTNHCDWYGIACCQEIPGSTKCAHTDFNGVIEVDLWNNNLAGTVPESIALLSELQSLFMSENSLTGSIPGAVFGGLSQLSKLYLKHNKLTGTIPTDFINNGIFDTLFVQGNDLNGSYPEELCPPCYTCSSNVLYFAVDCLKVDCTASCCVEWTSCYY